MEIYRILPDFDKNMIHSDVVNLYYTFFFKIKMTIDLCRFTIQGFVNKRILLNKLKYVTVVYKICVVLKTQKYLFNENIFVHFIGC